MSMTLTSDEVDACLACFTGMEPIV